MISLKNREKAYDLLLNYKGSNPYILMIYRDVITNKNSEAFTEFNIEYILKNIDFQPIQVNRAVNLADWYALKKKEDWNLDFIPNKIAIKWLIGETDTSYNCYVKYRKDMEPIMVFLSKKGVLNNFLVNDYNKVEVDFDRYDTLSINKDPKKERKLREHQKEAIKFLLDRKKCILADDMGLGKLEPISSLIPTPNGFKKMGDIVKGDMVFDMHGHAVSVLETFSHKNKDIYEVTFSDGSKVRCGLEHLWYVRNINWKIKRWETLSLEQLLEKGLNTKISDRTKKLGTKHRNKWIVPTVQPIEYPKRNLLIHPYILGLCIGDGNLCTNGINISIPETEMESANRILSLLNEGYTLSKNDSSSCPRYRIIKSKENTDTKNIYNEEIKKLKLNVHSNDKFIPEEYKISSIEQRTELLKGLMDSDGSITKKSNKIIYSTNSKQLAEDITELIFSLGGVARLHGYERNRKGKKRIEYQVAIQIPFCPFKLRKKVERYNPTFKKYLTRYIQSVELVGKEDAQCIYVDSPEHTYVTGKHYVVTHNTTSLTVAAIEGNFDSVLIICPASIKTTWKKELLWYVPERDISIIDSFNGKNKSELETFLGYGIGKSGKKVSELQEEAKERGKWVDNRFVIVNYDILGEFYKIPKSWSATNVQAAYNESPMLQYIANKKSLIIIDEAHRLSNTGSQRFKIIKDLIKRGNPHSIYEATGTPITNKPMNLFNVLSFLNDPITNDYQYYAKRYCNAFEIPAKGEKEKWTNIFLRNRKKQSIMQLTKPEEFELKKFIRDNAKMMLIANGESNLDELKQRVSHIYLRRVKEDLPNIVNKTVHEIFHDLSLLEMMEYNKLWDEYEEAQLTADPNKELNKELIEGGIYRRYLSNKMVPHTIELVEDLLESGRKVVIGTCYDEELKLLQDHFGKKCVVYNGKMNAKQKDAAKDKFMEDPECKVFIGQLIAAGVGLTLTAANALVFNTFDYVHGNNSQFMDRVHRLNQTEDVDIFYQIFRGTQVEKVWDIVLRKKTIADCVIKKESEK